MATTQQEVKELKQDIVQIKNMLADQLEETAANGESRTIFAKEELQRLANQAGKGVRTFFSDKQRQFGQAKAACEKTIKERPVTSAVVAFAGGMLLTTLLRRK